MDSSLQIGFWGHAPDHQVQSHVHRPARREVFETQEVVIVQEGSLIAQIFDESGVFLADVAMGTGDVLLLMRGGHGFRMLEKTRVIEVKQGPYLGANIDKVRLEESPPSKAIQ